MVRKDENAYLLIDGDSRNLIPCLFNPTEFSLTLQNSWGSNDDRAAGTDEATPGMGVQTLDFQGSQNGTLDLTLFFDTTAEGEPVTKYTSKIVALMDIDGKIAGTDAKHRKGRPPTVQFGWGKMTSFPSVIERLTLTFTYFSSTGMPLRATMQLGLKQYSAARSFGPQNPTSGTPAPHKTHQVLPGETLDRISAVHFGDATKWRLIAVANGVEDPLSLRPGRLLHIPKLDS
jgi:hypothetical protein